MAPVPGQILVVDDTPENIKVIAGMLQGRGYGISFANSGSQALDILEHTRPDLILLDVVMPEMDGYETCRRIKADPELAAIPVIFLTSLTETENVVAGLRSGAVDYLTKPVEKEILLARVNTHLTIRSLHKDLEDRVRDRTRELTLALQLIDGILVSMPSVLVSLDRSQRVVQWNPRAEERTGIPREKALGRPVESVLDHPAIHPDRIRRVMAQQTPFRENRVATPSGQGTRFEDVTIYALTGPEVPGVVIHLEDVTDQVQFEDMMIQSEKMMSLGGLAAGIAHEINNPLAGMIQNAELVSHCFSDRGEDAVDADWEAVKAFAEKNRLLRYLSNIRTAGHKAAGIVNDMLSMARKSDRKKVAYDLTRLMDETLALAAATHHPLSRYDFADIDIVKNYEPDIPPVLCNPSKLQQVFINILQNGAYAMGTLEKKNGYRPGFRITMALAGDQLEIRIRDNGPGMDKQLQSRIFNPFFTTKPQGVGTGLGLSISYFVVTNTHNGRLTVASEPGCGACFTIRLPLAS